MNLKRRGLFVRPSLIALSGLVALSLPATALAGGFTAHLAAVNHTPIANTKWRLTVTATRGSQKLSGKVSYRYLYYGVVVGHGVGGKFRNGVWHDAIIWPTRAVGHPLTFQAVVTTRYGTDYRNWWVIVRR
jgi:hypothetical protein